MGLVGVELGDIADVVGLVVNQYVAGTLLKDAVCNTLEHRAGFKMLSVAVREAQLVGGYQKFLLTHYIG